MWKTTLVLWTLAALSFDAAAQRPLSLDSAIEKALSANYELQIAQSELRVAQLQDYRGNAGETPRTAFGVNDNVQVNNVAQDLANGTSINRNGAFANALGANLQVNWTIFNGMRVTAIKQRVREQITGQEELLRAQMQATVAQVMQSYYAIVRQQYYLDVIARTREVSRLRKVLAEQKRDAGLANASDVLLAELDLSQREQAYATQELFLRQGMMDLLSLLNETPDEAYILSDTVLPFIELDRERILAQLQDNPQLLAAEAAIRASQQAERSVYANRMPTVQLSSGLAYNLSYNTGGFVTSSQSYGPFIGINANVPLLQNKIFNRQHDIARQQTETTRLRLAQSEDDLQTAAMKLWETYAYARIQGERERINVENSRRYLDLITERHRLNAATAIDLREAQRSYEDANFRQIDVQYQAVSAEIELLRLAGLLSR
jgi:outer membrane protein